jgi:hypothetical protein
LEWPPGSGRRQPFPELDRVAWFSVDEARAKVVSAQAAFFERLEAALTISEDSDLACGRATGPSKCRSGRRRRRPTGHPARPEEIGPFERPWATARGAP